MRVFLWKACALLLLFSGVASAQNSPLTFDQVVELVMQRSPVMGAEQASQRVAGALVQQAGTSPNPSLQLQSQTDGFERLSLIGLAVSQPIELGHKRASRVRVAESAQREASLEMEIRRRSLRRELRERFLQILWAQAKESIADELSRITGRHLEIAQKRLAQGDVSGLEVRALEVESERRRAQKALAVGEHQKALALLGEYLFGPEDPLAQGIAGELGYRDPLPSLEELIPQDLELVALSLAQARTQTKRDQVRLERSKGVSDLTVQAGVFIQRDYFPGSSFRPQGVVERLDDTGPRLQLQLQIPLPLNDNNSGNIAAAQARFEQSTLEAEALQKKLRAELQGLYHTLVAQREARVILEQHVLPESERTLQTVEQAYALGFRSQIDLLLARESYLKAADDSLQAAFAESLTAADLESLIGRPLPTESEPHD